MLEIINLRTVEQQLKAWINYLDNGIHSGNRGFDADKVKGLLERYKSQENPDQELIKAAEQILQNYYNWQENQTTITADNDYT